MVSFARRHSWTKYKPMNPWDEIKERLARRLSTESFQNWVAPTTFERIEHGVLWVAVPSETTRGWLEQEYGDTVISEVRAVHPTICNISYVIRGSAGSRPPVNGYPAEPMFSSPGGQLNPKFTFDSFVVGSCNQFAHAAAQRVATKPSSVYNPLFIYGGVGMGKTHLMHAIGRSMLESFAGMKIVYTSSERFMNEMINCIKLERMPLFHQHYRSADALLIDDIQIIGGKERTQEEFFHTFNELYDHQKQIILSSDSSPKEIPGLVERLRSRFEWGLMVDVQAPDLETKMAILDKKAEAEGIHLPQDVRIFLATKTKSNVRELEGALVKLIAYSSVTGEPISLAMAQQILKQLIHPQERKISIEAIIKAVAERHGLTASQLKQKTNARHVAEPRQVAMYLVKELTDASLPEIGRHFGGKHHTTVLYSIQKVEKNRNTNPDLNRIIHSVIDSFNK